MKIVRRYRIEDLFRVGPALGPMPQVFGAAELTSRIWEVLSTNRGSHRDAIDRLLRGESFADPGSREETIRDLCAVIAGYHEFRDVDPRAIVEVFRPAFEIWAAEPDARLTVEQEIDKALYRVESAHRHVEEREDARRKMLSGLSRALGVPLGGDNPDVASGQATARDVDAFVQRHAIMIFHRNNYVYDFHRDDWGPPIEDRRVPAYARDVWDGIAGFNVVKTTVDKDGNEKVGDKQVQRLHMEYGTVIHDVIGDMSRERSFYDADERRFYYAVAKRRRLEPNFDPRIDRWLRLFTGRAYETMCDWLAIAPQLKYQLCAPFLIGPSSAGKGLFTNGLARLWHTGAPTDFELVGGQFNGPIVTCPLIRVDEAWPSQIRNVSGKFRSMIGASRFWINPKGMTPFAVEGAIRFVVCANSRSILSPFEEEEISAADLDAISKRILHVPVYEAAARWLDQNNVGGHMTAEWVENGDGIARHCLALMETRSVKAGKRFMVEGEETSIHRALALGGEINALVFEWLARFITNPTKLADAFKGKADQPSIFVGDGAVFVNTEALIGAWSVYSKMVGPNHSLPSMLSPTKLNKALVKVRKGMARLGPRGNRVRYHVIRADLIVDWAEKYQIGNEDKMRTNIAQPLVLNVRPEEIEEIDEAFN